MKLHLLIFFVGVLPNEVSNAVGSHIRLEYSVFCVMKGQMLAFTGVSASLQELLTLLEWGVAGVGRNVLGLWSKRDWGLGGGSGREMGQCKRHG